MRAKTEEARQGRGSNVTNPTFQKKVIRARAEFFSFFFTHRDPFFTPFELPEASAERRTPHAERRTPNAERRTPKAERRTLPYTKAKDSANLFGWVGRVYTFYHRTQVNDGFNLPADLVSSDSYAVSKH